MPQKNDVADHYTQGSLIDTIRSGVEASGKTLESLSVDDLAPVDEFHIGGRIASEAFLRQLNLADKMHVIDVGCGLGGGSRYAAHRFGCRVTGIDLTPEFIEVGETLNSWVRLDEKVDLRVGSALEMPFEAASFDAAFMMHVGMNIEDKQALFREVYQILKPGTLFGVYDVMRVGEGEMDYPVPWATTSSTSALASPEQYKNALTNAGFDILAEKDRGGFAQDFFADLAAKTAIAGGPPALGVHLLMGETRAEKIKNMISNIAAGRIAPVEMIARK